MNSVVNSPEANIVGDIVGGSFQEKLKSVQNVVNATDSAINTFVGPKPTAHAQQEESTFESRKLQEGPLGESVVTSIQAIDQYGNIIAQARNPKLQQILQEQLMNEKKEKQHQQMLLEQQKQEKIAAEKKARQAELEKEAKEIEKKRMELE